MWNKKWLIEKMQSSPSRRAGRSDSRTESSVAQERKDDCYDRANTDPGANRISLEDWYKQLEVTAGLQADRAAEEKEMDIAIGLFAIFVQMACILLPVMGLMLLLKVFNWVIDHF